MKRKSVVVESDHLQIKITAKHDAMWKVFSSSENPILRVNKIQAHCFDEVMMRIGCGPVPKMNMIFRRGRSQPKMDLIIRKSNKDNTRTSLWIVGSDIRNSYIVLENPDVFELRLQPDGAYHRLDAMRSEGFQPIFGEQCEYR